MTTDKHSRAYARVSDLKAGDTIKIDGDFTCAEPWSKHEVKHNARGLYFSCDEGHHYLDGQLDDNNEVYVGVYKMEADNA